MPVFIKIIILYVSMKIKYLKKYILIIYIIKVIEKKDVKISLSY